MKNKYISIILAVVILGIIVTLMPKKQSALPENAINPLATYTNDEYGFEIQYPKELTPVFDFKSYYHLPDYWRSDIGPNSTGTAVVAIPVFRYDSNDSYPRYFDAEVRIGVSTSSQDLADCLTPDEPGIPFASSSEIINGVNFDKFGIESAGMMQYLKGFSYRIIHNGTCFAIEQLETGSAYRDDPPSAKDIPDTQLNAYFESLSNIVDTFKFTR